MIIKKNKCIIQYNVDERVLKFERQLIQLFRDNDFRFTGSGYGCEVRDLCFERIIKEESKDLKKEAVAECSVGA